MYELPVTVTIDGIEYPIRNEGDYRMVLDCFIVLQDLELNDETERLLACLLIFYDDLESVDAVLELSQEEVQARVDAMFNFFNCGKKDETTKNNLKLLDWEEDEQLIISAINDVAKKEVRAEAYVHWWTFMGYYMSIGEGAFATVVSIRYKILKGKKLEKYERDFRNDNPQYFIWNHKSVEEQEAENYVMSMWNNN